MAYQRPNTAATAKPQTSRAPAARQTAPAAAPQGDRELKESDFKLCIEVDGEMAIKEGTEKVWQWFGNGYVNKDGSVGVTIGKHGLPEGNITRLLLVKPKLKDA